MWPSEEIASRLYDLANWGLIVGLVLGVLSTGLLVWMGNVKETYLRKQLTATDSISAQANERSKGLEKDNLKLRTDLNTQVGQVAGLQVDASNAKAAQQKVEIALAAQQERAATAENSLIKLRESLKDRTISGAQEKILIESLRGAPSGVVEIWWTASDTDSFGLARQMVEIFKKSGWPPATERFATGGTGNGFFLAVRDRFNAPSYAVSIQNAYKLIGIDMKKVVMWAFGRICYEDGISPIKRETRFCYEMSVDERLETFMSQGGPAIYRMET